MGYSIKLLNQKNRSWKVRYLCRVLTRRQERHIPESEYAGLGLYKEMTPDQVRERLKQLNSQEKLKALQEKRLVIQERLAEENLAFDAYLPKQLITEFETRFTDKKKMTHWRRVKNILVETRIDIKDWNFQKETFYSSFKKKNYSYSYCSKLITILNQWGRFLAYKTQTYFEPVPFPSGYTKQKIIDNYEDVKGNPESRALTIKDLEIAKSKLKPEHHNWLYLSLWFGLRPIEVDSLKQPTSKRTWYIETQNDLEILWVYQTKLTGISREKRLKPIPIKHPEQKIGLEIIQSKNFKRPLVKTLKLHLSGQVTNYAGRKGFVDLMLGLGHSFESISQYMGHQSLDRTWKNYKDKKKII